MSELYFRQWLAGRDVAHDDPLAAGMANYIYVIGDRSTGQAVVVDPAYAPEEIVAAVRADGLDVVGVVATHYHADHVGGSLMGRPIAGVAQLLETCDVPVHVQRAERPWVERGTGLAASSLVDHDDGDRLRVGEIEVTLVHTPGHTPGSQCLVVEDRMVSGDTLFLEGCGRTDLPGSDPEEMYRTLQSRLAGFDGAMRVFPGHRYHPAPSAPLAVLRQENPVLQPLEREEWLARYS